jgi:hypothetical protein
MKMGSDWPVNRAKSRFQSWHRWKNALAMMAH